MSNAAFDFFIRVDDQQIGVHLRPHPRARTLRLRYDALRGTLFLTLPPRASRKAAQQWAQQQQLWIAAQLTKQAFPILVGPGTLLPWGDASLLVNWAEGRSRTVTLDTDQLHLGGPPQSVGARVGRWLRACALADFTDRTAQVTQAAGLVCAAVGVGDPRARWGSCNAAGKIRYSWRLMMAPDFVRSALVAHEVAHLAHMNHGPKFHALVDALAGGDHDRSRTWLKAHGRNLHRWRF
ncbi:MAG: M48 family metallopeptidase [Pseudomonadota bacterium]